VFVNTQWIYLFNIEGFIVYDNQSVIEYIFLLAEEDDDDLYRENTMYIHIREKTKEKKKMKCTVLPFIFISLYYCEQNG
jgi:hypothetical protein